MDTEARRTDREQTAGDEDGQSLLGGVVTVSGAFEGSEDIAVARDRARSFLTDVQAVHGLPVSARAMGMVRLVVSELVTNARKYAPGPWPSRSAVQPPGDLTPHHTVRPIPAPDSGTLTRLDCAQDKCVLGFWVLPRAGRPTGAESALTAPSAARP